MVYTCNGILPSHKKSEIFPSATTWMNLEGIVLSEVSHTKILHDITYVWNLKKTVNKDHQTETES